MDKPTRRALISGLTLGLAGVATGAIAQSIVGNSGNIAPIPDLAFVHPELRPFAAMMMKQAAAFPDPTRETLAAARTMMAGMLPPPLVAPAFRRQMVKGLGGAPDVAVYVINAKPGAHKPAIVHIHGGGFITGTAASMIAPLQEMATALDCVIVTVDYRLAPETTFAGSIDDNYAALKWVYDNSAQLGGDRSRIAVMGESAGGGHAALLAIAARDRGEVPIVLQVLIYPMLDDRTGSVTTPASPIGTILWTAAKNRFGWEAFLGQAPGTAKVPPQAVPARQANLKGLPPAFIGVGSIDLFVDEEIEYARRLIDSGIPAEMIVVPGAFHGFDGIAGATSVAKRFNAVKLDALRQAFASSVENKTPQ
jgi:acetyl esterase/lipase